MQIPYLLWSNIKNIDETNQNSIINISIIKKFNSEPVWEKSFLETNVNSYVNKATTNVHCRNPKEQSGSVFQAVIVINLFSNWIEIFIHRQNFLSSFSRNRRMQMQNNREKDKNIHCNKKWYRNFLWW